MLKFPKNKRKNIFHISQTFDSIIILNEIIPLGDKNVGKTFKRN